MFFLAICAFEATPATAGANYSLVILADQPIGYWRLGDSAASVTAADASGHGRFGIYSRGVLTGATGAIQGDPDTAALFHHNLAWVTVPAISGDSFNLANNFTLEAWVINDGQTPLGRIISRGWPAKFGFGWGILGNEMRFTTFGIKDYDSNLTAIPTDGHWHYVVVVFDNTNTAHFFLDGVQTDAVPGPSPATTTDLDLMIGRNPASTMEEFFKGGIDEVAIYNYTLSAAQIAAHFKAAQ
jgi:hypothetical protein